MKIIYHITTNETLDKAKAKGSYDFCALETEGFIHASTYDQTIATANRFFKGQENLIVLELDENKIESEVKYEVADQGEDVKFPHIYGPLNLTAIISVKQLEKNLEGEFVGLTKS